MFMYVFSKIREKRMLFDKNVLILQPVTILEKVG